MDAQQDIIMHHDIDSPTLRDNCFAVNMDNYEKANDIYWYLTSSSSKEGCGLAAPQIGINERAFIIDFEGEKDVYFNPFFVIRLGCEKEPSYESCLSIPGKTFRVMRYNKIKLVYQDIIGKWITEDDIQFDLGVIYQHEFDHLQGKTLFESGTLT